MTAFSFSILIFVVTLGLSISGLYFLFEAPAARKRFRARRITMQHLLAGSGGETEVAQLWRGQVFSEIPALNRVLSHLPFVPRLQTFLQQAGMDTTAGVLLLMCLGLPVLGFLVGLLASFPAFFALLLAAGAAALPLVVVSVKRQRRFSKFEELFPDAIDLLARAVRAGHAFTTGFELIAREMPEPIASEFQMTYEQQNLGMPLREALDSLVVRMPISDVRFFVSALQIQRESGGNLAEILDKLSYVIRERFKILRQVKVYTAEGRLSLYILTAVPPVTAALIFVANRDYIMTLFRDPLGHNILAAAIVLQVMGYVVIRRLTQLKV